MFWILEAVDHTDNYKPPDSGGPPIKFDLKLVFGVIAISMGQLGKRIELLSRSSRLSLFFCKNALE